MLGGGLNFGRTGWGSGGEGRSSAGAQGYVGGRRSSGQGIEGWAQRRSSLFSRSGASGGGYGRRERPGEDSRYTGMQYRRRAPSPGGYNGCGRDRSSGREGPWGQEHYYGRGRSRGRRHHSSDDDGFLAGVGTPNNPWEHVGNGIMRAQNPNRKAIWGNPITPRPVIKPPSPPPYITNNANATKKSSASRSSQGNSSVVPGLARTARSSVPPSSAPLALATSKNPGGSDGWKDGQSFGRLNSSFRGGVLLRDKLIHVNVNPLMGAPYKLKPGEDARKVFQKAVQESKSLDMGNGWFLIDVDWMKKEGLLSSFNAER